MGFVANGGKPAAPDAAYWEAVTGLLAPRTVAFVRESRVRLVLVLDTSGRIVTQHGFTEGLDLAAFASLAAGVHAASGEIARLLAQPGFSQLYQGRGEYQLFVGAIRPPVGELLLLAVFGEDTTIGLVRALFKELSDGLQTARWPRFTTADDDHNLEVELAAGLARVGASPSGSRPPSYRSR